MSTIMTNLKISLTTKPNFVVSETNTIEKVKNFVVDVLYKIPSV